MLIDSFSSDDEPNLKEYDSQIFHNHNPSNEDVLEEFKYETFSQ